MTVARGLLGLEYPTRRSKPEVYPMTPNRVTTSDDVLRRVQGEFLEMPGLRLTEPQARRLWNLDQAACESLLGILVERKFLFKTRDGSFMRIEHAAPVRALGTSQKKTTAA